MDSRVAQFPGDDCYATSTSGDTFATCVCSKARRLEAIFDCDRCCIS